MSAEYVDCDGCGQPASPEHIARRLQRLEWTTRWRPIHIATVLLGGQSPKSDADFLYAGKFKGEALEVLRQAGVSPDAKSAEAVLTEFQRGGFFLTHVLECPFEEKINPRDSIEQLLEQRKPFVAARIRRSLKPKRIVLISDFSSTLLDALASSALGCPILRRDGQLVKAPTSEAARTS